MVYVSPFVCPRILPFGRKTHVSDTREQPFNRFSLCRTDVSTIRAR